MKNVTISMDEEVARWVRIEAAKRNTSVSRLVGEMLKDKMQQADSYQRAMESYLSREPYIPPHDFPYPKREEIYDRPVLR